MDPFKAELQDPVLGDPQKADIFAEAASHRVDALIVSLMV